MTSGRSDRAGRFDAPWWQRAPWSWLRFLLIVPIYTSYRRRVDEQLKWRLAFSHVSVVLASIALISVVGATLIVAAAIILAPSSTEPARDARSIARIIERAEQRELLSDPELSGLLIAIQSGLIEPSRGTGNLRFRLDFPVPFQYLKSVTIIDTEMNVTTASDARLAGQSLENSNPGAVLISQQALGGSGNLDALSDVRPNDDVITGAYPLRDGVGRIIGAVVVVKTQTAVPQGLDMLRTALLAMGEIGVALAAFVAIPAIPVALVTGFRRANAISEPVEQLAVTAGRVAGGDLNARVEVRGEDEIAQLESEFNRMADQLGEALHEETAHRNRAEQLLAANRHLVSNVSHELRTPIAVVRGHLEALLDDPSHTEEFAAIALRETGRLERLVEDLFHLTRIESHQMVITSEAIDASAAAREAFESLAELARRESGITMICEASAEPLLAYGDRVRLVQVLQNLIRNAIRHTPEGGIILVSAEPAEDGDGVTLHVSDTGDGIPPEHLPHIFDRFYRADAARSHGSGSGAGLGLAIARSLIERMDGTISVDSDPGEGASFTIRLKSAAPRSRQP
jgi:signal transduction histidine kinase